MKTIEITKTETTFFVPANHVRAVMHAKSSEATRYYLGGVYMHTVEDCVTIVATDGCMLLRMKSPQAHVGTPIILDIDTKDKAFKPKLFTPNSTLWIHGDTSTGLAQFVGIAGDENTAEVTNAERHGVCEFEAIDGTFPDYSKVIPTRRDPETVPTGQNCFNPALLARMAAAHKIVGDHHVMLRMSESGGSEGDPMLVEFSGVPDLLGVMMPARWRAD